MQPLRSGWRPLISLPSLLIATARNRPAGGQLPHHVPAQVGRGSRGMDVRQRGVYPFSQKRAVEHATTGACARQWRAVEGSSGKGAGLVIRLQSLLTAFAAARAQDKAKAHIAGQKVPAEWTVRACASVAARPSRSACFPVGHCAFRYRLTWNVMTNSRPS